MSAKQSEHDTGEVRELTPTTARQGATPHVTRYVLGYSLALVILALAIVYAWPRA
jgi:hypothetical protein